MKKDRNCGMNNFPGYPNVMPLMQPGMPAGIPAGMPNIQMTPANMGGMGGTYPSNITNINTNEDEISKLEQRVNMIERRLAALEGNNAYGNYSSNTYQML